MSNEHVRSVPGSLVQAWLTQVRVHRFIALGMGVALLFVLWLLGKGAAVALADHNRPYLHYAVLGGMAGFGATALGAVLPACLRTIDRRMQDGMLGFTAGMMLAASAFSLLLPGLEAAQELYTSGLLAAAIVVLGLGLGVLLMLGLDCFTPHQHQIVGPHGPRLGRISGVWLFVVAIILHNLPEGMAIGVGFAQGDMSVGLPLATAIALQDVPEGLAITLALLAIGVSRRKAVLIAAASGLMEPLGAVVGLGLASGMPLAYPISLGLAAGAMIFVVSHEVIPETHLNGHETAATVGLMLGFGLMMFLDAGLG